MGLRRALSTMAGVCFLAVAGGAGCYTTAVPGAEARRLRELSHDRAVFLEHEAALTSVRVTRNTRLTLVTDAGETLDLRPRDASYSATALSLPMPSGERRVVPLDRIASVRVHRPEPAATALQLAALIQLGVLAAALLTGAWVFGH
jgi:anthranilate phosphoribosyltransferase